MAPSALLVTDVQRSLVDRFDEDGHLPRLVGAAGAARAAGLPMLYVVIGFRAGHPEVSPRNKVLSTVAGSGRFAEGDPGAEIHSRPAPRRGRRAGSTISCSPASPPAASSLSTVHQAADLGHRLTVLADGCLDSDPEVHDVLTRKVFIKNLTPDRH
ncbi:hypothetical protein AV521_43355 [Streptomyces sp. IMTB 2501]|nr:isochorismatase family protein [Streptomyces sp. IMTB 2501]OLZ61970.1 hypothetical protein AV521_43355 [Streptomyces sp. IMTB 2501]